MRAYRQQTRRPVRPRSREALRPTAARVRDALFNSLGTEIVGATVLDLFAGTGTLGIEALHRGAGRVVLVERDAKRARAIEDRLRLLGLRGRAEVRCEDALAALGRLARGGATFGLVLLDPPYGAGWLARAIASVAGTALLAQGGVIVAEGHWRDRPAVPQGLSVVREARYGETVLWFIRAGSRS